MERDEIEGQPYWVITIASFTLASAVQSESTASLAWGIALVLAGGVIFLFASRERRLLILPILGLLGVSSLPLTAAWLGVSMYSPIMPTALWGVFIAAQALVIHGYIKHLLRSGNQRLGSDKFNWIIYSWGLLLLPIVQYIIAFMSINWSLSPSERIPALIDSWPGLAACVLAGLFTFIRLRGYEIPSGFMQNLRSFLSFRWLYNLFGKIFQLFSFIVYFIDRLVEGRGAILWTLLILTLIISLLAGFKLGE